MVSSHFHLWVGLEKLVYSCHVHFHTSSSFFSLLKPLLPLHSTLTETTLVSLIEDLLVVISSACFLLLVFFSCTSLHLTLLASPSLELPLTLVLLIFCFSNITLLSLLLSATSFLVSFSAQLLIVYILQSFVLGSVFLSVYSFCLLPVHDFSHLLFFSQIPFLCSMPPLSNSLPKPDIWMQLYEILFRLCKPSKYQVLLIMPLITACAIPFIISFIDAKLLTISLPFTVFPSALPYVRSSLSLVLAVILASLK